MSKILLVLKNLKHDGTAYEAGSLLEADAEQFADLLKAGVVRVVEGAESLEHAAELVKQQVAAAAENAAAVAAAQPPNTWEAAKEEPQAPAPTDAPASADAPAPTDAPAAPETEPTETPAAPDAPQAPAVGTGDLPPAETNPEDTGANL